MKNREKFRNTIIGNIGTRGKNPCDFIRTHVFTYYGIGDCYSAITCAWCHVLLEMWLEEEYIDWLKIPVDTLVEVKTYPYDEWKLRYFSTYDPDTPDKPFITWCYGNTSKTTNGSREWYRYCRVAEEEDDDK